MSNVIRTRVVKVRMSEDEIDAMRARAGGAPLAAWLRNTCLGLPAAQKTRRRAELQLHPVVNELLRQVVWAGNALRAITDALEECEESGLDVRQVQRVVSLIHEDLRRCVEHASDSFGIRKRH